MDKLKAVLSESFFAFVVVSILMSFGIWVGFHISPLAVVPGLALLIFICLMGILLSKVIPVPFPAVGWCALVGIIVTVPGLLPFADSVAAYANKVPFLATTTPVLAYAGISVGKDWSKFAKIGWRGALVSLLVFTGTYIGSAVVAEIALRLSGAI